MLRDGNYWINRLGLLPHREGGCFRETYKSSEFIEVLRNGTKVLRHVSTQIYFLLQREEVSVFHRLQSDEAWHFYDGSALYIHAIDNEGSYSRYILGPDMEKDESLQIVINAGVYFAAELRDKSSYALVGCTVAPGFDYDDFEVADPDSLSMRFPEHEREIRRLADRAARI